MSGSLMAIPNTVPLISQTSSPETSGRKIPSSVRSGDRSVTISASCTACGLCLITCGDQALLRAPKRPHVIDENCTGCGACIEVCPVGAISDLWLSERLISDRTVDGRSGGTADVGGQR